MKIIDEFKAFAMRGNVLDLAIGIIIGGAFGKIVSSFVNDVLMPPIGVILGGVDFKDLKFVLSKAVVEDGSEIKAAVTWNYGAFMQSVVDFLIIAFAIFMLIKVINRLKKKEEEVKEQEKEAKPSKEELLLTEIRDELRKRN
jgi:large conductance mechanosensitive channel